MKKKPGKIRTLAVRLFEAGQRQKRKQPSEIWGRNADQKFHDLPSESVEVWESVAREAYRVSERSPDK